MTTKPTASSTQGRPRKTSIPPEEKLWLKEKLRQSQYDEYMQSCRELYRIGNNLNQIALKAHALGAIDARHYDEAVQEFREAVQTIQAAVLLPRQATR